MRAALPHSSSPLASWSAEGRSPRVGVSSPRQRLVCRSGWFDSAATALRRAQDKIAWELDYSNWAPRGARAFRLRELPADLAPLDRDKGLDRDEGSLEESVLASRLQQPGAEGTEGALTGAELRELCERKFGVCHDMAIKAVDVAKGSMDRFVALNIYVGHLGQRSFPYSEEKFMEKLDAVAMLLSAWNQAEYVRQWFSTPVAPRAGLPGRPRVDTAVSVRLNNSPTWDASAAEEWFSS